MPTDQLIQSLFVLFNIEAAAKSKFASDFNRYLIQMHVKIEELLHREPELKEGEQARAFMEHH